MLSLPSSASSPIGEAISVQQIKSCRTGDDQVPSTDSKMKWGGSGVGRQGGIERDGPLETLKGSWVERRACGLGEVGGRSGLENGHLFHIIVMWGWSPELQADASPQERTIVGILILSMAEGLSNYLKQGLAKSLKRAR